MSLSGAPKIEGTIVDYSKIASSEKKGKQCIPLVCERGVAGKVYEIASINDRKKYLGGEVDGFRDIYSLDRILEAGATVYVTRLFHYSDVDAATLASGVKATNFIGYQTSRFTAIADVADSLNGKYFLVSSPTVDYYIWFKTSGGVLTDPALPGKTGIQVSFATGATAATIATAIQVAVDAHAAFSAVVVTSTSVDITNIVSGTATAGAAGNSGFAYAAQAISKLTITGKEVGAGYNGITVTTVAAVSGTASKFDITVEIPGYPELTKTYYDVSDAPGTTELAQLNAKCIHVDFAFTTAIVAGTVALVNGTYLTGSIVNDDIIGSGSGKNGYYAFDSVKDAVRMALLNYSEPDLDVALASYCVSRGDMRFHTRTVLYADVDEAVDYRMGTGAYSHAAIDTYFGNMWTGGLKTIDPATSLEVIGSEMADVLAAYYKKDATGNINLSPSEKQFGTITNATKGVALDYGPGSMASSYDAIYNKGINAVIMGSEGYPKLSGNKTLQKADTLLKHDNIAEYIVGLRRRIMKVVEGVHFKPNDPIMWLDLYNRIKPLLKADEKSRAIRPTEDIGWKYIGDQFAKADLSDLAFNDPEDIDAGIYKFRVLVKPISATVYIGFEIGVTNSSINFEIVQVAA